MKRRLLISFSGGRTSAYMTWYLLKVKFKAVWDDALNLFIGIDTDGAQVEILVVFANTSKEREETLEFVRDCDVNFGFHTFWIEGVYFSEKSKGASFKATDYQQAKRKGEVYEEMIKIYGIPNQAFPHCTRELKTVPITKFLRSRGWKSLTYETYIGYRVDEPKRFNSPKKRAVQKTKKHVYYLADEKPTTKAQINGWWGLQEFNLNLQSHQGNCNKCWKKSEPKLVAIEGAELNQGTVDTWWEDMEKKYGNYTPKTRKECNPPYTFYRDNKSAIDIRDSAKTFYEKAFGDDVAMGVYTEAILNNYNPKQLSLCDESCEPF